VVAAAAADPFAHGAALEAEAAAGAGRRQQARLDEERAHQRSPEEHERKDERSLHLASIGTKRALDKIES